MGHRCGRSRWPQSYGRATRREGARTDAIDAAAFECWKLVIPHRDLQDYGLLVNAILALALHPRPALASVDLVQPGTFRMVLTHPSQTTANSAFRIYHFSLTGQFNDARQAIMAIKNELMRTAIYVPIQREQRICEGVPQATKAPEGAFRWGYIPLTVRCYVGALRPGDDNQSSRCAAVSAWRPRLSMASRFNPAGILLAASRQSIANFSRRS